jgi:ADP-heptose:LPS heptosyltransferase
MWGIGTIILGSPVFTNLRKNYPQAKHYFLTLNQNEGLYEDSAYIDETEYMDLSSYRSAFFRFFKIILWIWREKFDIVFDFEFGSRFTAILTFLSTSSLTVGYVPAGSGKNLFDITVPYNESIHVTQLYLRALYSLRLKINEDRLVPLPFSEHDRLNVQTFLKNNLIKKFVAFNPNTSELAVEREWPREYFGQLGTRIFKEYPDINIILIGGAEDLGRTKNVSHLIKPYDRVFVVSGKFSFRESMYLLSQALVLVSNDSGPLHLGVIADVPTVGLFGPETPVLYGPRGKKHSAVTANEICSPCISVYKDKVVDCHFDAVCMKNIRVETVFNEVKRRLDSNHR